MKKLICLVLSVVFLCLVACASASSVEKRNAFEFSDLYTLRLLELKEVYGIDATYDLSLFGLYEAMDYANYLNEENCYSCNVPAGTLVVSMPDFEIEKVTCTYLDAYGEEEKNKENYYRALILYAALEYDRFDDYSYSLLNKMDESSPKSVIEKAFVEFDAAISACLNEKNNKEILLRSDHTRIPFLSRNYDYALYSYTGEVKGEKLHYLYIEATAK